MRRAIICGSGVAGLSAAIALGRNGWSVDVYERSHAIREIGAGIFLKGNALRVLENFQVLDRIRQDCVVLQEARTLDSSGRLLQRRTLREVNSIWNLKRELLIRALHERALANGATIHTNSTVDRVDPNGVVTIADRERDAELVIVADGVNSGLRPALGLEEPVRAPLSGAIRLLISRTQAERESFVRESWSGRLRVGVCPCSRTEAFAYFIAPLADTRGARIPIDPDYWGAHFPDLASQGLFERAAAAAAVHHPYPLVRTGSWVRGRVALVGDAAHALPPTLGQGVGLSLMNTLLLSEYVSASADVMAGLTAWQRDWRWVTDRTQKWSRRYDWVTSEWPQSLYPLRQGVIWAIGKSRRFNSYMRVADRVDAPARKVLPAALYVAPLRDEA
jgi:2-polyprenyl-6-methoxyphenol hydroxylase-like FAD-dependent oxidoreductase